MKSDMKHKKVALILSALIILLFVVCVGMLYFRTTHRDSMTAEIYLDGELIRQIDLSTVTSEYQFTVNDGSGGSNTITVRPGAIGITQADCPDKLCVHQGFMQNDLLPIVCLPHHLVIRIVPTDSAILTDAVTY